MTASGVGGRSIVDKCLVTGNDAGILVECASAPENGGTVVDCVSSSNGSTGIRFSGGQPLWGLIRGCTTRDNGARGIDIGGSGTFTIQGCDSSGNGAEGIYGSSGSYLDCVASGNLVGIVAAGASQPVLIRGCTAAWNADRGILVQSAAGLTIQGCQSTNNSSWGIEVLGAGTEGANILDCTSSSNQNLTGGLRISGVWPSALIRRCKMENNNGHGILSMDRVTIQACEVSNNTQTGIEAFSGGSLVDCVVSNNQGSGIQLSGPSGGVIRGCTTSNNGGDGINVSGGAAVTVRDCNAKQNGANGIQAQASGAHIVGNHSTDHMGPGSAGIVVNALGSRVDSNHVRGNSIGIKELLAGNLFLRNSAGNNGTNYNLISPVVIVTLAQLGTNDNPHANYDF